MLFASALALAALLDFMFRFGGHSSAVPRVLFYDCSLIRLMLHGKQKKIVCFDIFERRKVALPANVVKCELPEDRNSQWNPVERAGFRHRSAMGQMTWSNP